MNGVISVEGIECYAFHGCLEEEDRIGGRYIVDVWLETAMDDAMESDQLQNTTDYTLIVDIVRQQMAIRSNLIEHVASRILKSLSENLQHFKNLTVKVSKLNPPVNGYVEKATVEISYKN
ncbi:MAG: dihydroneopterin aldolase [Bacteroidia bacterium]|nr:dihydroneopterin aldolase [Bacteroidia bacterium]MCZ2278450.1 dihydroneopterin aldolase [Bacteroidia bacterium]